MAFLFFELSFVVFALAHCIRGQPTSCISNNEISNSSDPKTDFYDSLCNDKPRIAENIDFEWAASHSAVWFVELGNDVARLHFSEVLQGRLLTYDDDFSELCGAVQILHGDGEADGRLYGFGNITANWKCAFSFEEIGLLTCDMSSSGLMKYVDHNKMYVTYTDNDKVLANIICFPNGEVGWMASSSEKILPEENRVPLINHMKSIGFDTDKTTTTIFDEKTCPDRVYT